MSRRTKSTTSKQKEYFPSTVDAYILLYDKTDDINQKNYIYNTYIKRPFEKLVECIMYRFKFFYTDNETLLNKQNEVVAFLVEKIPNFGKNEGKAYSYFSIVAKNYLINDNNKNYKKLIAHDNIDMYADHDRMGIGIDDEVDLNMFVDRYVEYMELYINEVFSKQSDKQIAYAVIEIFKKRDHLDLFNKKAIYLYIREMADYHTHQITRVVKVMYKHFKNLMSFYISNAYFPSHFLDLPPNVDNS